MEININTILAFCVMLYMIITLIVIASSFREFGRKDRWKPVVIFFGVMMIFSLIGNLLGKTTNIQEIVPIINFVAIIISCTCTLVYYRKKTKQ